MKCHDLLTLVENLLKTTGLQQDFEFLDHTQANRVQCELLNVLHKESNIKCTLKFTIKSVLLQSDHAANIIRNYMSVHPMCKVHFPFGGRIQNLPCMHLAFGPSCERNVNTMRVLFSHLIFTSLLKFHKMMVFPSRQ